MQLICSHIGKKKTILQIFLEKKSPECLRKACFQIVLFHYKVFDIPAQYRAF